MPEHLKIPEERIELLVAEDHKVEKIIEHATQTKLDVDKELCEVSIYETEDMDDPLGLWRARDAIKALGRGFEADTALALLYDVNELRVIDLKDFAGKSKNSLARIKSRIIGTEGKAKKHIEDLTDTRIAVYGKTVSIIGARERVQIAAEAVTRLAEGVMHSTAYRYIEAGIAKIGVHHGG